MRRSPPSTTEVSSDTSTTRPPRRAEDATFVGRGGTQATAERSATSRTADTMGTIVPRKLKQTWTRSSAELSTSST
eukprot:10732237-Heterocapsa_arctica.AAC.1